MGGRRSFEWSRMLCGTVHYFQKRNIFITMIKFDKIALFLYIYIIYIFILYIYIL